MNDHFKKIASLLLLLGTFGLGGAAIAEENDDWFNDDQDYYSDEGYFDDQEYNGEFGNDYGYDDQDDYGYFDSDYDWDAEEDGFDDWYGDADEDWDWF